MVLQEESSAERPYKRTKVDESDIDRESLVSHQHQFGTFDQDHATEVVKPGKLQDSTDEAQYKRLTEEDCGISVFVNQNLPRFQCIMKAQTSDFQVFEVDQKGQLLKLISVPRQEDLDKERDALRSHQKQVQTNIEQQNFNYESEAAQLLRTTLGDEVFNKIKELCQTSQDWLGEGANGQLPVVTEIIDDKSKRTSVHKGIRELFLGSIESEVTENKKMKFVYKHRKQSGQRGSRNTRGRDSTATRSVGSRSEAWTHGDYTIFTVYKDGRDTMDVANTLCRILKVPPKVFGYAGTKDRRGCTVQQFSAYRTSIARLASLNNNGGLKDITLGDFSYADKPLTLGDLQGNRFILALRDIQGSTDEEINTSFGLIREHGFVNYYGLQRFGTSSTGTHEVGIHVLQRNFEKACNLILSEHSGARKETKDAKLNWINTKNASTTLNMMPQKCIAEVAMLKHMVKTGQKGDWNGAFNSIPRNLRMMYTHAYQSFVWNHVVTQRLQRYGMTPIVGDLVYAGSQPGTEVTTGEKEIVRARLLTADELSNYTIYDIVLPLPGCDITYPENELKEYYAEFMKQHDLNPFDMVRNTRELSLLGSYRKIMSKPIHLEWQILKYEDQQQQLLATNLDELEGRTINLPVDGPKTAVKIGFQLETAAYATMLLREALASVPHSF